MNNTEATFSLPESKVEYIDTAACAQLMRAALKRAFPSQKFSVRIDRFAGGSSIDIRWTDGPHTKAVEAICNGFQGSSFDGMIDMATNHTSWLEDDGTAHVAHDRGTYGQKGAHPERIDDPRSPGAREVRFMATFVNCSRRMTPEYAAVEHETGVHDFFAGQVDWSCPVCQAEAEQRRQEMWAR